MDSPSGGGTDFSVTPAALSFTAQIDQDAPPSQTVVVKANEVQTEVPDPSYQVDVLDTVTWSFPSEDTMKIEASVKVPALVGVGVHETEIEISNSEKTLIIPVSYTVTEIPPGDPEIHFVAPYISQPNVTSEKILRGSGFSRFDSENLPLIMIGSTQITDISIVSDSEIRMHVPGLASGVHEVRISGSDIEFTSTAALHVIPDQVFSTTFIETVGEKSRLIFDKQRQSLYVVNTDTAELERYRFQSGTTWLRDNLIVPGLTDAALSPDGATLVLIDGGSFYELDPAAEVMSTSVQVDAALETTDSLDRIAPSNSGMMFGVSTNQWSAVYSYNVKTDEASKLQYRNASGILVSYSIYAPRLFPTYDGSQIFLGEAGVSTSRLYSLNASDYTISETGLSTGFNGYRDMAMSSDLSINLINGKELYDQDLLPLGQLPQAHTSGAISPDLATSYVFQDFDGVQSNKLRAFDISPPNSPTQVGEDRILSDGPGYRAKMVIANDGNTLFLAGTEGLHIIDLTTFSFSN